MDTSEILSEGQALAQLIREPEQLARQLASSTPVQIAASISLVSPAVGKDEQRRLSLLFDALPGSFASENEGDIADILKDMVRKTAITISGQGGVVADAAIRLFHHLPPGHGRGQLANDLLQKAAQHSLRLTFYQKLIAELSPDTQTLTESVIWMAVGPQEDELKYQANMLLAIGEHIPAAAAGAAQLRSLSLGNLRNAAALETLPGAPWPWSIHAVTVLLEGDKRKAFLEGLDRALLHPRVDEITHHRLEQVARQERPLLPEAEARFVAEDRYRDLNQPAEAAANSRPRPRA